MTDTKFPQDIQGKIDSVVANCGWAVYNNSPNNSNEVTYAFSVGFTETFDHPEVMIVGFSPDLMGKLINNVGALISAGAGFTDGSFANGILREAQTAFKSIPENNHQDHTTLLKKRYGQGRYQVLQMFLPDENGNYPWEPECDYTVSTFQTSLMKIGNGSAMSSFEDDSCSG